MKISSTTLCSRFLTLLCVMIFLESVHGRPYLIQGNELFMDKEDTRPEELLLALLRKNVDFQKPSNIGVELAKKLEEFKQLEKLKEQLREAKDAGTSYVTDNVPSYHPKKRACFWKYCV